MRRSTQLPLLSGEDNALPAVRAHPAKRHGAARRSTAWQGVGLAQAALLGVETQSGTPSLTEKGGAGPLTPPGTARGSRDTRTRSHAQPHQGCLL